MQFQTLSVVGYSNQGYHLSKFQVPSIYHLDMAVLERYLKIPSHSELIRHCAYNNELKEGILKISFINTNLFSYSAIQFLIQSLGLTFTKKQVII